MESRSDSTPAWRDQPAVLQPVAPPPAPASAGPLTAEHMQQLAAADVRAGKLRKAAGVAKFNGYTIAVFSVFSLMWGLGELAIDGFSLGKLDWVTFIIGAGLGVLAWNELRGRTLLMRFDPRATRLLGWNQLALLGLIVAYAAWMLGNAMLGPGVYDEIMKQEPMLADSLGSFKGLDKTIAIVVYGSLIAGTLIFQGLNSIYYFTRAKLLRTYIAETPAWVVELQRTQAGGLQ
jgi:hypothetical protein